MLYLQSGEHDSGYLLEHLIYESIGAKRGGGMFAWATSHGANLLLKDATFSEFLSECDYQVVVGLDSITDIGALDALRGVAETHERFSARAFLNPVRPLFHPKLSWFESDGQLVTINGSGNLTIGGLRSNWEAFTVEYLKGSEAFEVRQHLDDWLSTQAGSLLPLTDERVLARAQLNAGSESALRPAAAAEPRPISEAADPLPVLVAQIPRSGNRWEQANFDVTNYVEYFGASVGSQRRILLRSVTTDGSLSGLENRPSVEVKSQNYRFELAAAKAIPYPSIGRPIGVFVRTAAGEFMYYLQLPGDNDFHALDELLESTPGPGVNRMRRLRVPLEQLREAVPNSRVFTALASKGAV